MTPRPAPVRIVVFVTSFLMMHLALLLGVVATALGWRVASRIGLGLTAAFAFAYVWPDLKRHGWLAGWPLALVRYLADVALFIGAFIGGVKQRMLYICATVD